MSALQMTAQEIIEWLRRPRCWQSFVIPNFTPLKWWECDLFEMTKAGYFREYEVKISRADFKADAKKDREDEAWIERKCREQSWRPGEQPPRIRKHDLLAEHCTDGPVQFWYVTPEGLLSPDEIPAWAGLIEVGATSCDREVIKAPRLHRAKMSAAAVKKAYSSCYARMSQMLSERRSA